MFRFFLICLATGCAVAQTSSDSSPLQYTVFLGYQAEISSVGVDSAGSAYITGMARASLPVTAGSLQAECPSANCAQTSPPAADPCQIAFAGKLNPNGTAFSYLTYLPIFSSAGVRVAVDAQGDAWIAGTAYSNDLPVTTGAVQSQLQGSQSAFVIKLNPAGSAILFATYLGGNAQASGLALDSSGSAYVTGRASGEMPVTPSAFQSTGGTFSSFVARFDSTGKLSYATYLPGDASSETFASAIAVDSTGAAYVAGSIYNPSMQNPSLSMTPGAFQTTLQSPSPAFVVKLDPTGSKLIYATYLSGAGTQTASAIQVDDHGEAIVSGADDPGLGYISGQPFPITPGAFQTVLAPAVSGIGSSGGAFVLKLNAAGSALVFSTLFGGSDSLYTSDLKLDASGNVFVAGSTYALDLPTTAGAIQQCAADASSWQARGFVAEFSPDGSSLVYGSFLGTGGTGALALDSSGDVYIAGGFANFPVVPGSFGWTGADNSVLKLSPVPLAPGSVSCVASAASRNADLIAPGEIVDILGRGIGPAQQTSAAVVNGAIPTTLVGINVLFNGIAAPILSVGPDRIRAVVPFELLSPVLGNLSPTTIQVIGGATPVQPIDAMAYATAPAIYTDDGSSAGQALMINQDGTINSQSNPASQGSIVTMYATGLNQMQPALGDGAVATSPASLVLPFTIGSPAGIQVGNQPSGLSGILYAGAAPGMVAGVTQINLQIPVSIFHGITLITLQSGTFASQTGVYFYVK